MTWWLMWRNMRAAVLNDTLQLLVIYRLGQDSKELTMTLLSNIIIKFKPIYKLHIII